jgi:hypothetical protein
MQETPSFFSDPKVIISITAIIISVVSLFWTLANQWEQNRRWENLNNANPELLEIRLINWKEITHDEAHNKNWGYNPLIYAKGEATDLYVLPYKLVARDSFNNKIERVNSVYTLTEIQQELNRIQFKGKSHSVAMLFRPKFTFENMGKTVTQELSIIIDAKLPKQSWQNAFTSNTTINLSGGQTTSVHFDFELPIGIELPPQISFRISLKYKDVNNEMVKKELFAKWTTTNNFWSYEEKE